MDDSAGRTSDPEQLVFKGTILRNSVWKKTTSSTCQDHREVPNRLPSPGYTAHTVVCSTTCATLRRSQVSVVFDSPLHQPPTGRQKANGSTPEPAPVVHPRNPSAGRRLVRHPKHQTYLKPSITLPDSGTLTINALYTWSGTLEPATHHQFPCLFPPLSGAAGHVNLLMQ